MTLTQRNAIASPAAGLQVIVTGETGGEFVSMWNSSLAAWERQSLWIKNNNNINYNNGYVGIGDTAKSKLNLTSNNLGASYTTNLDSLSFLLENKTAAAAGAQQTSPAIIWSGNGWKTSATAASQTVRFRSYVLPTQGAASPTGTLTFESSINGASPWSANLMNLSSGGNLLAQSFSTPGGTLIGSNIATGSLTSGTINTFSINNITTTTTDGTILQSAQATSAGTPSRFSPALKWRGEGWNGTATTSGEFRADVRVTGGTNPITHKWVLSSAIGNTSYVDRFTVTNLGQVGIGTSTPAASAILDVTSTTQGVLFPRMTTTQKLAIGSPAAGLQVYDTTLNQMSYFNGSSWVNF
jgi:hypothetical protein